MTEKRFTLAYEKGNWWAVKDGDITLWKEETIALLNSLNEENEQLKIRFNEERERALKFGRDIDTLTVNNEQLKQRNQELFDDLQNKTSWLSLRGGELAILKRENEELKQSNQELNDELQETMGYLALKSGVEKENEKLKSALKELKVIGDYQYSRINELSDENEELKKVLGVILLEVKRDISNTNQTGEIKVFINPNSFDLISEVLKKYGALKEWYE